ncbi:MAG: hypothetical protein KatS3mg008_1979 [Acidimicrobiales bacterium]|nr:MAG: hypothetical protein KatS3mg008_1979 [Acidimicrobiales bacterium]
MSGAGPEAGKRDGAAVGGTRQAVPKVTLVWGSDATLTARRIRELAHRYAGAAGDSIEEFDADQAEDSEGVHTESILSALFTPPMFSPVRVMMLRSADAAPKTLLERLQEALGRLGDETVLLVEWRGTPPKGLSEAFAAHGEVVGVDAPSRQRDKAEWVAAQFSTKGVRLDAEALRMVVEHVGEEMGRVPALAETLAGVAAGRRKLSAEDVSPYLVGAGARPIWDITDAIDSGDRARAVELVSRALAAGDHPLRLLAALASHYMLLLAVEGAEETPQELARDLRVHPFRVEKATKLARRLGHERIREAIQLLHEADLDLKGRRELPAEWVMEVLVARLAHRCSVR